jgi:hypothetical protein
MASLIQPHWEAVPHLLRDLLAEIGQMPLASRFYSPKTLRVFRNP